MTGGEVAVVLGMSVAAVVTFLAVARRLGNSWYTTIGSVTLVGHVAFGVVVLPRLPYTWDIGQFHRSALAILNGKLPASSTTVDSFAALQSVLYATFTPDPVVVTVFNSLCAVLVAIPVADLARRLYPGLATTRGLVATVLLLPLPFVFLTVPMRDTLSVLLFFTLTATTARAYAGYTWPAVVTVPLWGALTLLRPEMVLMLLAGAVAGGTVVLLERVVRATPRLRTLVAASVGPALAAVAVVTPRIPVGSITGELQKRTTGGAVYLEGMSYQNGADVVLAAPVRALYFQYAPFPFHVTSVFDFVSVLMLPVLVVLTVSAYRSARKCDRDTAVLVLLLVAYGLGVVGYGVVDTNFGTTVRHRAPFTILLCVFAAPTVERWTNLLVGLVGLDPVTDSAPRAERVGD